MKIIKSPRRLAACLTAGFLLVACGSSGDDASDVVETDPPDSSSQPTRPSDGGTVPQEPAPTTQALTPTTAASGSECLEGEGTPVVIGTVGTQSGVSAQWEAAGPRAIAAWAASVNENGGVNCHPIEYTIKDDNLDPAQSASLVRELAEGEKVDAFIYLNGSSTIQASEDYLASSGIPVIGGTPAWEFYYDHPNFFPQVPMGVENIFTAYGMMSTYGGAAGISNLGVLSCQETPTCTNVVGKAPEFASDLGLNLVYTVQAPLTTPDYTAQCLAARDEEVELFLTATAPTAIQSISDSCGRVGFDSVQLGAYQANTDPTMSDNPTLDGLLVALVTAPWFDTSLPAVEEYQATIAQYGEDAPSGPGMMGWAAAKLLETALLRIPPTDEVTRESLTAALHTIANEDLGGLTGPLTFTAGENAPRVRCWWIGQIVDGEWVSPNDGERTCV